MFSQKHCFLTFICSIVALLPISVLLSRAEKRKKKTWPQPVIEPKGNPTSLAKVRLGKQLFFDSRLSGDNKMSCATCHRLEKGFGDGLEVGIGHRGRKLSRNTQTLLNVAYYPKLFWDGRATTLEEQALMPIQSPDEMNQDLTQLEEELNAVTGYVRQFKTVFGTKVTRKGIAKALAAFQRSLVTGPSPYDRYVSGDRKALSAEAKRGMELFFGEAGCSECHTAPTFSDGKFYRLGASFTDKGLESLTGKKKDRYRFRTPSLRNVADTAPYMHDGSLKTLGDVVTFYYRGVPKKTPEGLEMDLLPLTGNSFSEITDIVEFLRSLSGKVTKITIPTLPK